MSSFLRMIYLKGDPGLIFDQDSSRFQSGPSAEENASNVVENPYYGDAEDFGTTITQKSGSIPDFNDVERITTSKNVYYEL